MNTLSDYKDYNKKRLERHYFNLATKLEETAGNDIGKNTELVRLSYTVILLNKYNQDAIIMLNKACKVINNSNIVSSTKQLALNALKSCQCE